MQEDAMQDDKVLKHSFSNRRDWVSFLAALQGAATYPTLLEAVKTSRDWFTQGASQASNWLAGPADVQGKISHG